VSAATRRSPLRGAAALLVKLRWVVIIGWLVGAIAAAHYLPSVGESATGAFGSLIPTDAPAIQARIRSAELFAAPLLTETAIVQRRAEGMTRDAQRRVFLRAERLLAERPPAFDEIAYALPVTNSLGVIPEADESGTTAITFLFYPPRYSLATQQRVAREFIAAYVDEPDDAVVGVTGAAPARVEQVGAITDALPLIEAATVTLILLVVGVHFRGVVAPLVVLFAVGVAYLVSVHVVGWAGGVLGYAVPGSSSR
jgi:RND superfamily putative drug exporter